MPIHFHHRKPHRIGELTFIGVIMAIALAMADTYWAIYMKNFISHDYMIGFISTAFTVLSSLSFFFFIPLVAKADEASLYIYCLLTTAITYAIYYFTHNLWVFLLISISSIIASVLRRESYGILIKENSSHDEIAKDQGIVYTLSNIGWLLGPLIAGFVAEEYGVREVYAFAAVFMTFALLIFIFFKIKDYPHRVKIEENIIHNLKKLYHHKELLKTYILSLGLNIWWTVIYIYIPLLIADYLNVIWIGYFLFAIPIPLVLLEYFAGKYEHKFGAKNFFKIGYFIMGTSALSAFFIKDIFLILTIFVFASIAVALVEPTRESYFFQLVPEKDHKQYYGPYISSIDIGSIIGRLICAIILIVLHFNFIFLGLAVQMFLMAYTATTLQEQTIKKFIFK